MEHSLCDSVIVLKGRLSVINFVDLPNHDEFTEQQLWCTDPWTSSSSLISQFLPLLPDNLFSKQKQSDWSFLNVSNFCLTSTQDPPMGFHHIHNKTQTPYSSFRSSSYSRPCLSAQSPFLLPFHSLCSSHLHPNSSGSRSFHFFVQTQRLGTYYTLTNNIHAKELFCKYRI